MRKSTPIALGGIMGALCTVIMFMTGIIPFATFAFPAISGAILVSIVIEYGTAQAFVVYAAVSLLSAFVVPDREAAIMFIAFFGYYPIIKSTLERVKPFILEYILKFAVFNSAIFLAYYISIQLFGMQQIIDEFGEMGLVGIAVFWLMGNITFFVYDKAMTNVVVFYLRVLRPKLKKAIK